MWNSHDWLGVFISTMISLAVFLAIVEIPIIAKSPLTTLVVFFAVFFGVRLVVVKVMGAPPSGPPKK